MSRRRTRGRGPRLHPVHREPAEVGCVVEPIKRQLIERPALAQHLFEIRADLDRARHGGEQEQSRRLFYRLLNEEQAAE